MPDIIDEIKGLFEKGFLAAEGRLNESINAFKGSLSGEAEIRFYFKSSAENGDMGAGIQVLTDFINRTGYGGEGKLITLICSDEATKTDLEKLFPWAFLEPDEKRAYGGCKLNVDVLTDDLEEVNFAFTGACAGARDDDCDDDYYNEVRKKIKVKYFLILQPYLWDQYNERIYSEQYPDGIILKEMYTDFCQHAVYVKDPEISEETWRLYEKKFGDEEARAKAIIAHTIIDKCTKDGYRICPVYGMHVAYKSEYSRFLYPLVNGCLASQKDTSSAIVIVCFNSLGNEEEIKRLREEITQGTITKSELQTCKELNSCKILNQIGNSDLKKVLSEIILNILARKKYAKDLKSAERTVIPEQVTHSNLDKIFEDFRAKSGEVADKVLVLSVGSVPYEIFNYFYSISEMPSIFEGQGTANLAVNIGKPYIQTRSRNNYARGKLDLTYPSTDLLEPNYGEGAVECRAISEKLGNVFYDENEADLGIKNSGRENAEALSAFILKTMDQTSDVYNYFVGLREYYHGSATLVHDRLMIALAILEQIIPKEQPKKFTALEDGGQSLAELYDKISQLIAPAGVLDLLSVLPEDGGIRKFYQAMVGDKLEIYGATVAKVEKDGETVEVTLKGERTDAFGFEFKLEGSFKLKLGELDFEAEFWGEVADEIGGVPWIIFEDVGFELEVNDGCLPPQGGITGKIKGTDLKLQINYPVGDKSWLISGAFEDKKTLPGIELFYQMLGGVNVKDLLPEPLNTLSGFGLSAVQMQYEVEEQSISCLRATMQTDSAWTIIDNPKLEILPSIDAIIYDVGKVDSRSCIFRIYGDLFIGEGKISVRAQYPDFQLQASLVEGNIKMHDIASLFGFEIDLESAISAFDLELYPESKEYNLQITVEKPWTVAIFEIEQLGFTIYGFGAEFMLMLCGSIVILPDTEKIGLDVSASYTKGAGWDFCGKQTSGVIPLIDILKEYIDGWNPGLEVNISGLSLDIKTGSGSWEFGGTTAAKVPIKGTKIDLVLELHLGYNNESSDFGGVETIIGSARVPVLDEAGRLVALNSLLEPEAAPGYFGFGQAEIEWNGIELTVYCEFEKEKKTYGIDWGGLHAILTTEDDETTAVVTFTHATTLGGMVETMIEWATGSKFSLSSPWSILDTIELNNLKLTFNFTKNEVELALDIEPIEIGVLGINVATITGGTLGYKTKQEKSEDNGVWVQLDGTFYWKDNKAEPLKWDATKPETAPAPPAQGNKYIDLRFLALGQHVEIKGLTEAGSITQAVELMKTLPEPQSDKIPEITLNSGNGWLVGMDFGLLRIGGDKGKSIEKVEQVEEYSAGRTLGGSDEDYTVGMQIVFCDSNLYGLHLSLRGKAAKVFKGLDLDIMYRQINSSVGVYQAEINLPDRMRYIKLGQLNIILPVLGVQVYTNGDFQIDLGFPWNADFSRSFTFQTIIYVPAPIPITGSIGLYFAKLSSATATQVPQTTKGIFNPVVAFGIGIQAGLGYDFNVGVLSAGFKLTMAAIIEGVIAKWNPYVTENTNDDNERIEGDYYFEIHGTVGLIGKLYGNVDFVVIKASINIDIKLLAQFYFAPYEPIELALVASVSASASIRIIFVTIHFSFSITITHHLTLPGVGGVAPWSGGDERLPLDKQRRLARAKLASNLLTAVWNENNEPNWDNLLPAVSLSKLQAYMVLGVTASKDENSSGSELSSQKGCGVVMMTIDSVNAPQNDRESCRLKAAGELESTAFEMLVKQILRWVIAAFQAKQVTEEEVDNLIVSVEELTVMLDYINNQERSEAEQNQAIETFMTNQFIMEVKGQDQMDGDDIAATYFPIVPGLSLNIVRPLPAVDLEYTFAEYNSCSKEYLNYIRDYFDDLSANSEQKVNRSYDYLLSDTDEVSVATLIFTDYFNLIVKQMLQMAINSLKNFKYNVGETETLNDIVAWVNTTGDLIADPYTLEKLLTDNKYHPLCSGKTIILGSDNFYETKKDDTLNGICNTMGVTLRDMVDNVSNGDLSGLFIETEDLNIAQLLQFKVGELLNEIQRTQGIQHLSGLVSRYYMAGLHLPTPKDNGLTPKYPGMWVEEKDGEYVLPESCGLFALTGQQLELDVLSNTDAYSLIFTNSDCKWLSFDSNDNLSISITAESAVNKQISAIMDYAHNNYLDLDIIKLGSQDLFVTEANNYSINSFITWVSPVNIPMPYAGDADSKQELKVWKIPDELLDLPDLNIHEINPMLSLQLGTNDEASQTMEYAEFENYGWGTRVDFSIKKIKTIDGVATTESTYELTGAEGINTLLLERMVAQLGADDELIGNLYVAYAQDGESVNSSGIQTDAAENVVMSIAQVNLSTVTRPDSYTLLSHKSLVNNQNMTKPLDFIRLLWEASITHGEGYYFYYYNKEKKIGLPDRIFGANGEAKVSLIVLFSNIVSNSNQLCSYMNVLATSAPVDFSSNKLSAKSLLQSFELSLDSDSQFSLNDLATQYFADVDQLVQDNKTKDVGDKVVLTIKGGVYVVTNKEPGGNLSTIASYFRTTVEDIIECNPQLDGSAESLGEFTALYLPAISLEMANWEKDKTLENVSGYYNVSLAGIAQCNKMVKGIFAGQKIKVVSGPLTSSLTVSTNEISSEVERYAVVDVPDDPDAISYGEKFLKNDFSILTYNIMDNYYFNSSNNSMPICPSIKTDSFNHNQKFILPCVLQKDTIWAYNKMLSYLKFINGSHENNNQLLDSECNPYDATGKLLQLNYCWQDIYGNRLLTALDDSMNTKVINKFPILTKYSDVLIALCKWPAITSHWQVLSGEKLPVLKIIFEFASEEYNGLLKVSSDSEGIISAFFTNNLDASSAIDVMNYSLDNNITIKSIQLDTDNKTVFITTVEALPSDCKITLKVENICSQDKAQVYTGSAYFYCNESTKFGSTLMSKALADRSVFETVRNQINDKHDVNIGFKTSLLPNDEYELDRTKLDDWLKEISEFVRIRSVGEISQISDNLKYTQSIDIDVTKFEEKDIFKLKVEFVIQRLNNELAASCLDSILYTSTEIMPLNNPSDDNFIALFEEAFKPFFELRIASGVDRFSSLVSAGSILWALRLADKQSDDFAIGYEIKDDREPIIFTAKPISNQLISYNNIPIMDFTKKQGLSGITRYKNFIDIDVNLWLKQLVESLDEVLSPEYTTAIQIVDNYTNMMGDGSSYLKTLLDQKKSFAEILSKQMVPVFSDQASVDHTAVQERFEQELLVKLSNLYNVRSGIEFWVDVYKNKIGKTANLYGKIKQKSGSAKENIQYSASKISLEESMNSSSSFFLYAPQILKGNEGNDLSAIDLDLQYEVTAVEHQIGEVAGISNYEASSWLKIFSKESSILTARSIYNSSINVPLILNMFPDAPSLIQQSGVLSASISENKITELLEYDYRFKYSQPFHYPQDKMHFKVMFNVTPIVYNDKIDPNNVFPSFAQFIIVLPQIKSAFKDLSTITFNSDKTEAINTLNAYIKMLNNIIINCGDQKELIISQPIDCIKQSELDPFEFSLIEGSGNVANKENVLIISICVSKNDLPCMIPVVSIENYTTRNYRNSENLYQYYFTNNDTNDLLSVSEGQKIQQREISIMNLDILRKQNISVSVYLERNNELVENRQTNKAFVFTTGEVEFPNYYYPNFIQKAEINIASIITGKPEKASLDTHLNNLFDIIMNYDESYLAASDFKFKVVVEYEYQINAANDHIKLPIILRPFNTNEFSGLKETPESISAELGNAIYEWLDKYNPTNLAAKLIINLSIFSTVTTKPKSLIQLCNLYLNLCDII